MEEKKQAIYVHGLGSGAASTTIDIVRKVFPEYEWTPVEVNENPTESISVIDGEIARLNPGMLMGTSMGGLYLMYADMEPCLDGAVRILFNPGCDIARVIRETIGFGEKEYFVPRQDGVQHYVLDEAVCKRFEDYIAGHARTPGRGADYAVFSLQDELVGQEGVRNNMEICTAAGYRILTDPETGHRLRRSALRLMRKYLEEDRGSFSGSVAESPRPTG